MTRAGGRAEGDLSAGPRLASSDVDELHAATRRKFQRTFQKAATAYQGAREYFKAQDKNSQIISAHGITGAPYHFTWQHLPPANGGWFYWPTERPWRFIALHSFGDTADAKYLKAHRNRLFPPGIDKYGHRPSKWATGLKIFGAYRDVLPPPDRRVGIHFLISRRGDVAVFAGLNDTAQHLGGEVEIVGGRNNSSIGFELELLTYRKEPGGRILYHPYHKRQLTALAVVLRKIEAVRPIVRKHLSIANGLLYQTQTDPAMTGYLIHSEVKKDRADPGAQFNIPQGQKGSGWDQLFGYMSKIRPFNLATNVFVDDLKPEETKSIRLVASAMSNANAGSKVALRAVWAQSNSMRRAMRMATQRRSTLSSSALAQVGTLNDRVSAATASILDAVRGFNIESLPVMKNVPVYNEENDSWETV